MKIELLNQIINTLWIMMLLQKNKKDSLIENLRKMKKTLKIIV